MQLSKVIITAMPSEAEKIIQKYGLLLKKEIGELKIYEGERKIDEDSEHIVLAISGVGKTQSAHTTAYIVENYQIEKIINIGVVGNLNHGMLKIGDVMIPNTIIQHDMYIPESIDDKSASRAPIFLEYAIDSEYDLEKFSLHLSGICVTGDQFIDSQEKLEELAEKFSADIVDMEAYSILSVLRNYNMLDKAVIIKSVSDGANNESAKDHANNLDFAMENANIILDFVL